ncbi:Gfo/Idh/MocA family protein [Halobacillus massiliensis]|uniref:Gfo/Idh/MocA family protein n=1 Tax=Halobacillus massiliensis TaxID=1926286 RepID=UPI0009E57075|nr:Gfo/Idh/MocA family oxidoreductase [Halobacillus massiliensis]
MKNILLIGAGTMGTVHAQTYQSIKDANLVGIVDFRKEKANELAKASETQAFYSLEDAVEELEQIDLIDICLPTHLHKEYVQKAADLGVHVCCEKPLALTLEEADEMMNYCDEKGVRLFVGHVVRFFPEYVQAKEKVEQGVIGKPAVVRTSRGGVFPTGWTDWYADFNKSGGLLLDLVIHDFDYLRWCFGEVERVFAKNLSSRRNDRNDYSLVTLRFNNGIIAHVEGTWAHEGFSSKFEFAGTKGIIDYDSSEVSPVRAVKKSPVQQTSGVVVPESPLKATPFYKELSHFIECLEKDQEPIVTPQDGYKAMEIAFAAKKSAETGEPVYLNHNS